MMLSDIHNDPNAFTNLADIEELERALKAVNNPPYNINEFDVKELASRDPRSLNREELTFMIREKNRLQKRREIEAELEKIIAFLDMLEEDEKEREEEEDNDNDDLFADIDEVFNEIENDIKESNVAKTVENIKDIKDIKDIKEITNTLSKEEEAKAIKEITNSPEIREMVDKLNPPKPQKSDDFESPFPPDEMDGHTFDTIMISGVPVVNFKAFIVLEKWIKEGKKTLAKNFSNCHYFICNLSQELTLLKYATQYKGKLVSSKFLRKLEKAKCREILRIERIELKKAKRRAKHEEEIRKIHEEKEMLLAKLDSLYEERAKHIVAPGEAIKTLGKSPRTNFSTGVKPTITQVLDYMGVLDTPMPDHKEFIPKISYGSKSRLTESQKRAIEEMAVKAGDYMIEKVQEEGIDSFISDKKAFYNTVMASKLKSAGLISV